MSQAVKIILRIVVIMLIIAAIASVVAYFITRGEDQKQVFPVYSEVYESQDFKTLNEKVSENEDSNRFLTYGNTVNNNYKSINMCYRAQLAVLDELFLNTYYVSESSEESRKSINTKLAELQSSAAEALVYANIFETTQDRYGAAANISTTPEYRELKGIFEVFQGKFLVHTNIMCQLNLEVYNFVNKYAFQNSANHSLKYQLIEILCKQCAVMTDNAGDFGEYNKYYQPLKQMLAKYNAEKQTNFASAANLSGESYRFLKAYGALTDGIRADFIAAKNKAEYYQTADIITAQRANLGIVYDYFGISKGA